MKELAVLRALYPFPDPRLGPGDGPLALGGSLAPGRLLSAYSQGIFPWYDESTPILWWSPDPRFVLLPDELHVPRRLARRLRSGAFRVTFDRSFAEVVRGCASRPEGGGTWITDEMAAAYVELHALGFAHSVECWHEGRLAGGLYGVSLGGAFFGESMFHRVPDASKVALVRLVETLRGRGPTLVDCQQPTEHLVRFGAREVPRDEFLGRLEAALETETHPGPWPDPE